MADFHWTSVLLHVIGMYAVGIGTISFITQIKMVKNWHCIAVLWGTLLLSPSPPTIIIIKVVVATIIKERKATYLLHVVCLSVIIQDIWRTNMWTKFGTGTGMSSTSPLQMGLTVII